MSLVFCAITTNMVDKSFPKVLHQELHNIRDRVAREADLPKLPEQGDRYLLYTVESIAPHTFETFTFSMRGTGVIDARRDERIYNNLKTFVESGHYFSDTDGKEIGNEIVTAMGRIKDSNNTSTFMPQCWLITEENHFKLWEEDFLYNTMRVVFEHQEDAPNTMVGGVYAGGPNDFEGWNDQADGSYKMSAEDFARHPPNQGVPSPILHPRPKPRGWGPADTGDGVAKDTKVHRDKIEKRSDWRTPDTKAGVPKNIKVHQENPEPRPLIRGSIDYTKVVPCDLDPSHILFLLEEFRCTELLRDTDRIPPRVDFYCIPDVTPSGARSPSTKIVRGYLSYNGVSTSCEVSVVPLLHLFDPQQNAAKKNMDTVISMLTTEEERLKEALTNAYWVGERRWARKIFTRPPSKSSDIED
jgi:hypothetical protein